MTFEAWMNLAALLVVAAVCMGLCVFASSDTRKRLGCWLIASAKMKDKMREARAQFKVEQRLYQMSLEERYLPRPVEEEKRVIELAS